MITFPSFVIACLAMLLMGWVLNEHSFDNRHVRESLLLPTFFD